MVVVLDDLHWADRSSLELLQFVARRPRAVPLVVLGAYRDDELEPLKRAGAAVDGAVRDGRARSPHGAWSKAEVEELVGQVAGRSIADRWPLELPGGVAGTRCSSKELSQLLARHPAPDAWVAVAGRDPATSRDGGWRGCRLVVSACCGRPQCCGNDLVVDVVAEVCGDRSRATFRRSWAAEGIRCRHLVGGRSPGARARFAHDLFRDVSVRGAPGPGSAQPPPAGRRRVGATPRHKQPCSSLRDRPPLRCRHRP